MDITQAQKAILEVLTNIITTNKIGTLEYQKVLDTERH